MVFSRLDYPDRLVNYTITRFIADNASDQPTSRLPAATNGQDPVRIVLPFKDQVSADIVRTQLNDLSQKIHKTIQPVFVSQKINQHLKLREAKPPLVNQQSLVYQFKCDLCDAGYVGFTRRHLHQRVDEHSHTCSSIGKHFRDKHSSTPKDLTSNFTILKKCNSKFDCLIYEMFFINELRPSLNVQCDSIRAKVFKLFSNNFFIIVFKIALFLLFLITRFLKIFMLSTFVTSLFYYITSTYVNFYLHFA